MSFIIAFGAFVVVFLLAAIIYHETRDSRNGMFVWAFATYISIYCLLLPLVWATDLSMFKTVTWTMQIVGLNKEFVDVYEVLGQAGLPSWFVLVYDLVLTLLYAIAPLITAASIVLRVFRSLFSRLRLRRNPKRETWFFSKPSEEALLFAKNALMEDELNIVFCNVPADQFDLILKKGMIPFTQPIIELKSLYFRRYPSSVFFMTEDENKNLEEAILFAKNPNLKKLSSEEIKGNKKNLLMYVFTSRPEAELLLNSKDTKDVLQNKGILCRRIAENRAAVYREIMDFGNKIEKIIDKKKELSVLLLGCGWIGSEILDAFLWMYGRETTGLHMYVIDRADKSEEYACSHPGLLKKVENGRTWFTLKYDNMSKKGVPQSEAEFIVEFIQCDNIFTLDMCRHMDPNKLDLIYVALGEDNKNLECAVNLRKQLNYSKRMSDNQLSKKLDTTIISASPEIRVVLRKPMSEKLGFEEIKGQSYNITAILDESSYYSIRTLLNYDLEKWALAEEFRYRINIREDVEEKTSQDKKEVPEAIETEKKTDFSKMKTTETGIEKAWRFVYKQRVLFGKMMEIRQEKRIKDLTMDVPEREKNNINQAANSVKDCLDIIESRLAEEQQAYGKEKGRVSTINKYSDWREFILENGDDMQSVCSSFYMYDYSSCSSRAAALYKLCNVKRVIDRLRPFYSGKSNGRDANDIFAELPEWERIRMEEHWRWNIYMFTRGYHNNGDRPDSGFDENAIIRDDIARIHPNIIPYEDLKPSSKEKDGF